MQLFPLQSFPQSPLPTQLQPQQSAQTFLNRSQGPQFYLRFPRNEQHSFEDQIISPTESLSDLKNRCSQPQTDPIFFMEGLHKYQEINETDWSRLKNNEIGISSNILWCNTAFQNEQGPASQSQSQSQSQFLRQRKRSNISPIVTRNTRYRIIPPLNQLRQSTQVAQGIVRGVQTQQQPGPREIRQFENVGETKRHVSEPELKEQLGRAIGINSSGYNYNTSYNYVGATPLMINPLAQLPDSARTTPRPRRGGIIVERVQHPGAVQEQTEGLGRSQGQGQGQGRGRGRPTANPTGQRQRPRPSQLATERGRDGGRGRGRGGRISHQVAANIAPSSPILANVPVGLVPIPAVIPGQNGVFPFVPPPTLPATIPFSQPPPLPLRSIRSGEEQKQFQPEFEIETMPIQSSSSGSIDQQFRNWASTDNFEDGLTNQEIQLLSDPSVIKDHLNFIEQWIDRMFLNASISLSDQYQVKTVNVWLNILNHFLLVAASLWGLLNEIPENNNNVQLCDLFVKFKKLYDEVSNFQSSLWSTNSSTSSSIASLPEIQGILEQLNGYIINYQEKCLQIPSGQANLGVQEQEQGIGYGFGIGLGLGLEPLSPQEYGLGGDISSPIGPLPPTSISSVFSQEEKGGTNSNIIAPQSQFSQQTIPSSLSLSQTSVPMTNLPTLPLLPQLTPVVSAQIIAPLTQSQFHSQFQSQVQQQPQSYLFSNLSNPPQLPISSQSSSGEEFVQGPGIGTGTATRQFAQSTQVQRGSLALPFIQIPQEREQRYPSPSIGGLSPILVQTPLRYNDQPSSPLRPSPTSSPGVSQGLTLLLSPNPNTRRIDYPIYSPVDLNQD